MWHSYKNKVGECGFPNIPIAPLLDVNEQYISVLRVLVHILVFAFRLSMTVHEMYITLKVTVAVHCYSIFTYVCFAFTCAYFSDCLTEMLRQGPPIPVMFRGENFSFFGEFPAVILAKREKGNL